MDAPKRFGHEYIIMFVLCVVTRPVKVACPELPASPLPSPRVCVRCAMFCIVVVYVAVCVYVLLLVSCLWTCVCVFVYVYIYVIIVIYVFGGY